MFLFTFRKYAHANPAWEHIAFYKILRPTTTRLTPFDRAYLDSPLTANDFWALKRTASGKTPGPGGLPLDYYNVDLPIWSSIFKVIYGSQFHYGWMTTFQRRAQVSLLYNGGDCTYSSNYRPIYLLNVNAKLGPRIFGSPNRTTLAVTSSLRLIRYCPRS